MNVVSFESGTRNRHTSVQAFTLIEMLVVIAIIALLVSLIFPAVTSTLQRARITQCQSNQSQIAKAMLQYPIDHNGRLPFAEVRTSGGSRTIDATERDHWAAVLIRNEYISAPTPEDEDAIPANSVFLCPAGLNDTHSTITPGDSPWTTNENAHSPRAYPFDEDGVTKYIHVGYGINSTNPSHRGWPFGMPRRLTDVYTLSAVSLASRTVMIYDGKWMHNRNSNRIFARHSSSSRRKSVITFFDGSVQVLDTQLFNVEDGNSRDLFPRFRLYSP